ncbi:carbohydrate ABC transporter permease [Paenibacillus sp. FJAT-27812]|uniref:carbohydrate ABC transporter permease n=1 Tax=Paenibacillus sp. FJAT-27812 TaxID=1684143 RepID=UPI0006A76927|nr:carbohydrate ABC transporter permease [Paenibacillus sp. FJAT-27812]
MVLNRSWVNRLTGSVIIIILSLISILSLLPVVHILALSFSEKSAAAAGQVVLWPVGFNLAAYDAVVNDSQFFAAFWVSIKRVILGVALQFIMTVLVAYPMSRETRVFHARNVYMWFLVFTMLFSGGLIPWYITIRDFGLMDSIWALVIPGAVPIFNVILLMNFFRNLPKELDEAASMDGAGPWYTLFKLYLPLSLPALATVTLFSIVGHWNAFFDGLVLINDVTQQPLQTYLNQMVVQLNISQANLSVEEIEKLSKLSNKTVSSAKIFVSMIPILVIYPFMQRFFIHGITLGSVKE